MLFPTNPNNIPTYVTDAPPFRKLADLRGEAKSLVELVEALGDCEDTPQRCLDLHQAASEFLQAVCSMCVTE